MSSNQSQIAHLRAQIASPVTYSTTSTFPLYVYPHTCIFQILMCSTFSFDTSDRIISNLDTLVPFDSTKAYDILDVIYPVSTSVISTVDRLLRCHLTL